MLSAPSEEFISEGSPLKSESLRLQTPFGPAEVSVLEAPINNENISSILHAITTKLENDTIRFLMVAVGKLGQVKEDDLNNISWHIIVWGGAINHIQVVNSLKAKTHDGNFAEVLGLKNERATQSDIVLAGYIEGVGHGNGIQLGIKFSSSTLKKAGYPVNTEEWRQKFVMNFPGVKILDS